MLIGELAARSGVSARSLRYYEAQGPLTAERGGNGYRDYPESAVERAAAIQSLFGMGFSRDIVGTVLTCAGDVPPQVHADVARRLRPVRDDLAARIAQLSATHEALGAFLDRHVTD